MIKNCFIFARGGSKGIRNKNLMKINRYTLVEHSILFAKKLKIFENIFISSDSSQILEIGHKRNIKTIKRPKRLSLDNSPEWLAWQHAINYAKKKYGNFDLFVSLPPTAPLRSKTDILNSIKKIKSCDAVITYKKSHSNPWFNMVSYKRDNLKLVNSGKKIFRRQDAPVVFDMTTVAFVLKPDFILNNNSIWDGKVKGTEVPVERAIDIDDQIDLDMARFLYNDKFKQ